jgi:pSer/pThr/pTyr-binding forkhead associated (FHA) protein
MEHMEIDPLPIARLRWQTEELLLYPGQQIKLGRSAENDIVLNDAMISRVHAVIAWNESGFILHDQGSINGTFINTLRLQDAGRLLRDGDEVSLSKHIFIFEIIRAEAADQFSDQQAALEALPARKAPRLVVSSGPDMGQEYPLWGEIITIGRASREATWEIRLTDRSVSRPHARLQRQGGVLLLLDLESANGTTLNGEPVTQPTPVNEGNVIALGETRLVYKE